MIIKDFIVENGILTKYTGSAYDVVVPEGVNEIANEAFSGCGRLSSVTIPESVRSIGWGLSVIAAA